MPSAASQALSASFEPIELVMAASLLRPRSAFANRGKEDGHAYVAGPIVRRRAQHEETWRKSRWGLRAGAF